MTLSERIALHAARACPTREHGDTRDCLGPIVAAGLARQDAYARADAERTAGQNATVSNNGGRYTVRAWADNRSADHGHDWPRVVVTGCPRCYPPIPQSPFTRRALAGQLPAKEVSR